MWHQMSILKRFLLHKRKAQVVDYESSEVYINVINYVGK